MPELTDEQAAKMMVARLSNEPMGYVSWKNADGEVVEAVVVGECDIDIPKNATDILYSWRQGVRSEDIRYSWRVSRGVGWFYQPYLPWDPSALRDITNARKVHFKYV